MEAFTPNNQDNTDPNVDLDFTKNLRTPIHKQVLNIGDEAAELEKKWAVEKKTEGKSNLQ
jgi:hypothetical protein